MRLHIVDVRLRDAAAADDADAQGLHFALCAIVGNYAYFCSHTVLSLVGVSPPALKNRLRQFLAVYSLFIRAFPAPFSESAVFVKILALSAPKRVRGHAKCHPDKVPKRTDDALPQYQANEKRHCQAIDANTTVTQNYGFNDPREEQRHPTQIHAP